MTDREPSPRNLDTIDNIDQQGLLLHLQAFLEVTYVRQTQGADWTRQIMYDFFTEEQETIVSQALEAAGAIKHEGEWWVLTDIGLQLRTKINDFYRLSSSTR